MILGKSDEKTYDNSIPSQMAQPGYFSGRGRGGDKCDTAHFTCANLTPTNVILRYQVEATWWVQRI